MSQDPWDPFPPGTVIAKDFVTKPGSRRYTSEGRTRAGKLILRIEHTGNTMTAWWGRNGDPWLPKGYYIDKEASSEAVDRDRA